MTTNHTKLDFYVGILSALAVVAVFDEETIFRAIVDTVDEGKLVEVARKDGAMQWSGLSKYRYGRTKSKE